MNDHITLFLWIFLFLINGRNSRSGGHRSRTRCTRQVDGNAHRDRIHRPFNVNQVCLRRDLLNNSRDEHINGNPAGRASRVKGKGSYCPIRASYRGRSRRSGTWPRRIRDCPSLLRQERRAKAGLWPWYVSRGSRTRALDGVRRVLVRSSPWVPNRSANGRCGYSAR